MELGPKLCHDSAGRSEMYGIFLVLKSSLRYALLPDHCLQFLDFQKWFWACFSTPRHFYIFHSRDAKIIVKKKSREFVENQGCLKKKPGFFFFTQGRKKAIKFGNPPIFQANGCFPRLCVDFRWPGLTTLLRAHCLLINVVLFSALSRRFIGF